MSRITRLEAYEVRVPLHKPLNLGAMLIREREYLIVEIEDEHGVRGRSISFTRGAPVQATIARLITPRWLHHDLTDYPALYHDTVRVHRFLGTNGIYWRAISAVDCAVYDLLAKQASVPLCVFLGGQPRPVAVTLAGCYPTQDETADSIAELMSMMERYGAAGIKLTASSDYEHDTERLRTCRNALKTDTPLIIDLYAQVPDVETLLPWAEQWAEFNMLWLEDPFWFDEFEAMATLSRRLPYHVGVGDEQSGVDHFRNLIEHAGVGIVRLDATVCGGVTGFRAIAALATQHNRRVSCHIFHHLHAHLAAAVPNVNWIEYMLPQAGIDGLDRIVTNDLAWQDGALLPDAAPGVNYVWDEDALRHFRM
jgi:D-arabinonate dehydratase